MELTYLDLAINNLVINIASGSEEICEVDAITKLGIAYDSETRKGSCGYDNLKGIPLTDEWFDNFDFIKISSYLLGPNYREIEILFKGGNEYAVETNDIVLCRIQYVHELQNLWFSLTKQQLKIKPF